MKPQKTKKLRATWIFDKKTAKRQTDIRYYSAQLKDKKDYWLIEKEKIRLKTPHWEEITKIIEKYKSAADSGEKSTTGKILFSIYEKSTKMAKGNIEKMKFSNLTGIIARTETLLLAYKRVRKNKGALTRGCDVALEEFKKYDDEQRMIYYRKNIFPDGISLEMIELMGRLLKRQKYPWGSSKRIWLDKPGDPTKKRPITIPPFMDRIVQEAIKMVIEAIWEPYFETMNRSFGYRSNKGSHDAIAALKSNYTGGLYRALEGDIKAAYDRVTKEIMLRELEKKIADKKFMKLIKDRLNYDYVDKSTNERIRPEKGIPQGGIDSPYLFNIYLYVFDQFIMEKIKNKIEKMNKFTRTPLKVRRNMSEKNKRLIKSLTILKENIKNSRTINEYTNNKKILYDRIKLIRKTNHIIRKLPYDIKDRAILRMFYVRYADDWLLLTNAPKEVVENIKQEIKHFLHEELEATLSEEKTTITDIRKKPAKFLGFEIAMRKENRFLYIRRKLRRTGGKPLILRPDKERLINRMYTRGFCDKRGRPKELSWLSTAEPQVIIERYNASMNGTAQYYYGWIKNKSDLNRWLYILRYSCFKTLACKYKTSISKLFKKYGTDLHKKSRKTIQIGTDLKIGPVIYEKFWKLKPIIEIRQTIYAQNQVGRLSKIFLERENGKVGAYEMKHKAPRITHENFLDKITWVSMRTRASFDLPCSLCGSKNKIEMHHIKHIRKSSYSNIKNKNFLQLMALKNRKQIPVCQNCHINVIHKGIYTGESLNKLINYNPLVKDSRIITIEAQIKPGNKTYHKNLLEKGWKIKLQPDLSLPEDYE